MSEVFEFVEEALDAIAQFVGDGIVRDLDFAVALGGDHGFGLGITDKLAQGVGVIGFVGDDAGRGAIGEKVGGGGAVVVLSRAQDEAQGRPWASARVWILVVNPPRERPRA